MTPYGAKRSLVASGGLAAESYRNLSDRSAIVQNEFGLDASRIDRDVGIRVLLARGKINRCKRDSDAFLSQEDPNPP